MGNITKYNNPCLDVDNCGSSNAMQIYEDGGAKCFSCWRSFSKVMVARGAIKEEHEDEDSESGGFAASEFVTAAPKRYATPKFAGFKPMIAKFKKEDLKGFKEIGFQDRDITKVVTSFYGVRADVAPNGVVLHHSYPYDKGSANKIRVCDPKTFYWVGPKPNTLFGQDKFSPGGLRVVVTEGEMDCMAMQQANYDRNKKFYPVVGVQSTTNLEALVEQREWLRSFKEVVLCFDNDEPGRKALKKALRVIGYDKCKVMTIEDNDIGDSLIQRGSDYLVSAMFNAQEQSPAGIATRDSIRQAIIDRAHTSSHPYVSVLAGINKKVKGKRGGEIALFISGTGCGKSTLFREEILNVIATTVDRIGIVSLEESIGETGQKLAAMNINKNPAEENLDLDKILTSFDGIFTQDEHGEQRVMVVDHQGAITDNTVMDQLEYMCLKGCKYIFIDHITILVSEGVDGLTGNEAQDKVMNDLLRLVKRYPDVWIGLISHLRKAPLGGKSFESGKMPTIDDIRGSGSVKQIAFDIFAFARDTTAEDPIVRCTVDYAVLKCRWNGNTGPAGRALYDSETGRMKETSSFEKVVQVTAPQSGTFKALPNGTKTTSPPF